jgi:non-lysosomal glucosylceramidase
MRKCNCSGHCYPQDDGFSRREFLGLVGTGVAMSLVGPSAWGEGAFELPAGELDRWKRSLTASGAPRVYTSDVHKDARMHLGGIGTGNFEIGADGRLTTWQLFNTLRDGQVPFYFCVKAAQTAKLLQTTGGPEWPRVKQIQMTGEYPLATLRFRDDDLPVRIELTAFSPMEPLDADFSSTPLAIFRFTLKNPTSEPQTVSLAAMMTNPVGYDAKGDIDGVRHPDFGGNINEVFRDGQTAGLLMRAESRRHSAILPGFGTLALATAGSDITAMDQFEDWSEAWQEFSRHGRFSPPGPMESDEAGRPGRRAPTPQGRTINGAIASTVSIPPGGAVEVPFYFAWHYPNSYYKETGAWIGCHYATRWTDARAVIAAAAAGQEKWIERTERYRRTLYDSTLPDWLLDCLTANSAIIRHIGVVFRIQNGDIYGWEGSNGCCDPTCTHVWGYEQSLARLFPDLERDMRRIDFQHQQNPDGGINNRTDVPSPPHPTGEHPFADGHASCILKAYREALNSPDDSFFKEYWPNVKLAVEYLIHRDAVSNGGGQPCGVLADDQWNTYDEALHGVTTFISGYYLAALRAGEEWARRMGESASADRFHAIFLSGQAKLVELCWNGEYFQQHLPDYLNRAGEVGPGCMADQLLGQWWAHQLGLGYILPRDQVRSALRSIFKYNWKSDLTGFKFMPRSFAGANDKGLLICTWPRGGRPAKVMTYSDEVWTGIEYQVAAHMIYEGFLEEGFSIAKSARDRYDGVPRSPIPRNPWCEIECGGHYTRAMSSWSLLLALSGWKYDGPRGELCLTPCYRPENFKSFFTGPEGWGSFAQTWDGNKQRVEIAVQSGALRLKTLELTPVQPREYHPTVMLAGKTVPVTFTVDGARYRLNFGKTPITIKADHPLEVLLG